MRRALVPTYRRAWADSFTYRDGRYAYGRHPRAGTQHARSAYAFTRPPVMFVTVEVFHMRPNGTMHIEVVGAQLRWLRAVLARRMPTRRSSSSWSRAIRRSCRSRAATTVPRSSWRAAHRARSGERSSPSTSTCISRASSVSPRAPSTGASSRSCTARSSGALATTTSGPMSPSVGSRCARMRRGSGARGAGGCGRSLGKRPLAHPVVEGFREVGSMQITAGGAKIDRRGRFRRGRASHATGAERRCPPDHPATPPRRRFPATAASWIVPAEDASSHWDLHVPSPVRSIADLLAGRLEPVRRRHDCARA